MDRQKLVRSLVAICVIILLATVASRIIFKTGETLDEYADSSPEVALVTQAPTPTPKPEPTKEPTPTPEPSKVSNSNGTPLLSNGAEIEGRYEYADGFYCEAVSAKLSSFGNYGLDNAMYIHVMYNDFTGSVKDGEMVCDAAIAADVLEIFSKLYDSGYKIEKIDLLKNYDFLAPQAMNENITFASGNKIIINPLYNPYVLFEYGDYGFEGIEELSQVLEDGRIVIPSDSSDYVDRDGLFPYKIDSTEYAYRIFTEHGFTWGGDSNADKKYCLFYK